MSMTGFPTDDVVGLVKGALDVERTAMGGAVPVRLPRWAWSQVPDLFTREMFRMSSGVRLALKSEATTLELEAGVTRLRISDLKEYETKFPIHSSAVDLFVDGQDHAERQIEHTSERTMSLAGDLLGESEAGSLTLRFDDLPDGDKELEVWLPAWATVELRELRANAPVRMSENARAKWIHYGSSISHCAEAPRPSQTWPAVAAQLARVDLINLGVGGSCHLDPFVARAIRDTPAECISLKIGTNIAGGDTLKYRTFVPAIHGFLDTVRDGHPDIPIVLVSPIICPVLEESPGPVMLDGAEIRLANEPGIQYPNALSLRRMREILEETVETRSPGDPHLHYLDGLRLFGEADLPDLPDGVHPNPAGYVRIGERFAELVFGRDGCFAEVTHEPVTS